MITFILAGLACLFFFLAYFATTQVAKLGEAKLKLDALTSWTTHVCQDLVEVDERDGFLYWRSSNEPLTSKESALYFAAICERGLKEKQRADYMTLHEKYKVLYMRVYCYDPNLPLPVVTPSKKKFKLTLNAPTH